MFRLKSKLFALRGTFAKRLCIKTNLLDPMLITTCSKKICLDDTNNYETIKMTFCFFSEINVLRSCWYSTFDEPNFILKPFTQRALQIEQLESFEVSSEWIQHSPNKGERVNNFSPESLPQLKIGRVTIHKNAIKKKKKNIDEYGRCDFWGNCFVVM